MGLIRTEQFHRNSTAKVLKDANLCLVVCVCVKSLH